MLDAFAILSSTLCILYVVLRAAQMDRTLPWFDREPAPDRKPASSRGDAAHSHLHRR